MARWNEVGKHKTHIRTDGSLTSVRYHQTDVVQFDADLIHLDTGGWKTNTTKLRMNQTSNEFGLDFQVYQEKFEWYVVRFVRNSVGDLEFGPREVFNDGDTHTMTRHAPTKKEVA